VRLRLVPPYLLSFLDLGGLIGLRRWSDGLVNSSIPHRLAYSIIIYVELAELGRSASGACVARTAGRAGQAQRSVFARPSCLSVGAILFAMTHEILQ